MMLLPHIEGDFALDEPFELVSGNILPDLMQHYAIYGELNRWCDNAVLVFHALSGSARIDEWWPDLIGAGKALDTDKYCFICANYIGSCYGSTGALSINPQTNKAYETEFPLVTTRDVVRAQVKLLGNLKIERLKAVIGGSIGGQLALQIAIDFPDLAEKCVSIGACELPALALALNHLQREAIRQTNDVSLARAIAMITYKSAELFDAKFARKPNRNGENPHRSMRERFDVAGYLDYQGAKFVERFDCYAYNTISKMMDTFEIALGYQSSEAALKRIKAQTTLVGISSDWLFPAADVLELTFKMQSCGVDAEYIEMISPDGHDAFLSDAAKMSEILRKLL
jgi:homoserine O-acetyltransferase